MEHPSKLLKALFYDGINAVNGYNAVKGVIRINRKEIIISGNEYPSGQFKHIIVAGAGKASVSMAKAIDDLVGERIERGIVITKYGHGNRLKHIDVLEAGHPLPDQNSIDGTKRILNLSKYADEQTLLIMLLSGGASSLLVAPDGILLEDKIKTTELLLKSGAGIDELNTVRKQLSLVKGGGLANAFFPAHVITLMISDVIGNKLDTIGSGPTVKDSSTSIDALKIIQHYGLIKRVPIRVKQLLEQKSKAYMQHTRIRHTKNIIIADNRKAIEACRIRASKMGLKTIILTDSLHGEAKEVAKVLASIALELKHKKINRGICLISGGETTVNVIGKGKGGRNQELALSFAMELKGIKGITLLSAGTDGTDGPTDAAGAIVDYETITKIKVHGIEPYQSLLNNDSYTALDSANCLLKTGPTDTNVMDLQLIIVNP